MKTLKKTLCLVLAVVMAVGVLVIPANAATFDDADEITHDEAVAVLSGLGIVKGDGTGNFDPDGQFTRREVAVLLAQVVLTPEDAALLDDSKAVFTDVPVTDYANKYITWAVEENLIHGVGDNKFEPDRKLTGLELAALMLEVLGETLDSANLNNFVALKTKEYGLSDGITGYSASKIISREDAVQMMFNAMKRSPEGGKAWYVVNKDGDKYGPFDSSLEAALMANALTGYEPTQLDNGEGSILDETYKTTFSASTPDAFGRPTSTWKQTVGNDTITLYQKANTPAKGPYYDAVTVGEVFKDEIAKGTVKAKLFVDGDQVQFSDQKTTYSATSELKDDVAIKAYVIGGPGCETTVYKNSDGSYNVYVVTTKIAKADANNLKDGVITLIDNPGTDNDVTYTDSTLGTGDYVIYQAYGNTLYKAQKAEVKTGTVSRKSTKDADPYFIVDGAKYYFSKAPAAASTDSVTVGGTYNLILDFDSGYVVKADEVKGSTVTSDDYAYVIDYAEQQAASGKLLGTGAKGAAARAQVFDFETNKVITVDLAIAQGSDGSYYLADADGDATSEKLSDSEENASRFQYKFVTYTTTDDGKWVILTAGAGESISIDKAGAKVTIGSDSAYASSTTVLHYLYEKTKGTAYTGTSYIGYKNFVATTGTGVVVQNSAGAVTDVYVIATSDPAPTVDPPQKKAIYVGTGDALVDGTEYKFYVDGELTTFLVKDISTVDKQSVLSSNLEKAVYVKIDGDKLKEVSAITISGNHKTGKVGVVGEDYLTVGSDLVYTADDLVIYDAVNHKLVSEITIPDGKDVMVDAYAVKGDSSEAAEKLIDIIVITEIKDATSD